MKHRQVPKSKSNSDPNAPSSKKKWVRVHGFRQVVELLLAADPHFRESLLKRLAQRDPKLALSLQQDLVSKNLIF